MTAFAPTSTAISMPALHSLASRASQDFLARKQQMQRVRHCCGCTPQCLWAHPDACCAALSVCPSRVPTNSFPRRWQDVCTGSPKFTPAPYESVCTPAFFLVPHFSATGCRRTYALGRTRRGMGPGAEAGGAPVPGGAAQERRKKAPGCGCFPIWLRRNPKRENPAPSSQRKLRCCPARSAAPSRLA